MKNHPSVSIIIPAYNASRTIADALKSVLVGTFQDFEIIVCDDASDDRTSEVVASLRDERIHLVQNATNVGEGASRNRAVEAAKGRWIALLDADDIYAPERLTVIMEIAEAYPESIIFDELLECHDTPNGLVPWRSVRADGALGRFGAESTEIDFADLMRCDRTVIQPVVPLDFIHRHKIRHSTKRFSEDLEFILDLASHGATFRYIPKAMYFYRITPGSMSGLSGRSDLLLQTLTNGRNKFTHSAPIRHALEFKIRAVERQKRYMPFFQEVMSFRIFAAAHLALSDPWVIGEFIARSFRRAPYHISRIIHHGSNRGSR